MAKKTIKQQYVSIHTPTKGVTKFGDPIVFKLEVSIHTPTKGVTQGKEGNYSKGKFQSTHPRRV